MAPLLPLLPFLPFLPVTFPPLVRYPLNIFPGDTA
jgi:hypothetical protein